MSAASVQTRGTSVPNYSDGGFADGIGYLAANNRGEQLFVNSQPSKAEIVRLGDTWSVAIATASAFTHVAGMPTTRAELALYNGEPDTGKCYIIDTIWWMALTSIAAAAGATLIAQVQAAVAALSDDTAQLIHSPLGRTYGGRAKRAVAVTTMVANRWQALGNLAAGPAASIGVGITAEVNGGIIVVPGATLGVNVVVGTAAGTGIMGISWHEALIKY